MTIVRREHRAHFTIVPNAVFVDQRLSVEAKGVLGYLLSRPHKWHVRLDNIGGTLLVGRKKLQRIFRELISAGYVSREQRRMANAQRFGRTDYVVRDVPVVIGRPVDKCPEPRVQKGPAARNAQVRVSHREFLQQPRGRKGPAYKELKYKKLNQGRVAEPRDSSPSSGGPGFRRTCPGDQEARYDPEIVAMFRNPAAGWEFLGALPNDVLAQVRQRQQRGELDETTIIALRNRYCSLPCGSRPKR